MEVVKIIWFILIEYILITKMYVISLIRQPSSDWMNGERGDVVLIQGFFVTWVYFYTIAQALHSLGFRIHVIHQLDWNLYTTEKAVQIVKEYIEEKNLHDVNLLSFSKGGIIAKCLMDETHCQRIRHLISICTPYQGTMLGYLRVYALDELIPGSPFLTSLLKETRYVAQITNLYAKFDNHILPTKNSLLPGAKNIQISTIGHTRVLESKETLDTIVRILTI